MWSDSNSIVFCDTETPANFRQKGANPRKIPAKGRNFFCVTKAFDLQRWNPILVVAFIQLFWIKARMSTERLSSCNTLRVGCDKMGDATKDQLAIAENHKESLDAKIKAG